MLLLIGLFMNAFAASQQLMLVLSPDWSSVKAQVYLYERDVPTSEWRLFREAMPAVIGKKGLAWGRGLHGPPMDKTRPQKKEGDGKAPAGIFSFGHAFGYETAEMKNGLPFHLMRDSHVCVDDSASSLYNQIFDESLVSKKTWKSAERMKRTDSLYKFGAVINHNTFPVTKKGGSCIFLHIWRSESEGTAGCTALSEAAVMTILQWLNPAKNPRMVQLPQSEYRRLQKEWNLPLLP